MSPVVSDKTATRSPRHGLSSANTADPDAKNICWGTVNGDGTGRGGNGDAGGSTGDGETGGIPPDMYRWVGRHHNRGAHPNMFQMALGVLGFVCVSRIRFSLGSKKKHEKKISWEHGERHFFGRLLGEARRSH